MGLPEYLRGVELRNVLTGETVRAEERDGKAFVLAGELLRGFPVALLVARDDGRVEAEEHDEQVIRV